MTHRTAFDCRHGLESIVATLGGPDVIHVFAHAMTSFDQPSYHRVMGPGLDRWAERALLMARPHDIVCLATQVDEDYRAWLSQFGLGVALGRIVTPSDGARGADSHLPGWLTESDPAISRIRELVSGYGAIVLNPYLVSSAELRLADRLSNVTNSPVRVLGGNLQLAELANSKHVVRARALELGIPVADGTVIDAGDDRVPIAARAMAVMEPVRRWLRSGPIIVRASRSSSGSGILAYRDASEVSADALQTFLTDTQNRHVLVERLLTVRSSPNILMHITGDRTMLVGATDQHLDSWLSHQGNVYPSVSERLTEMIDAALKLSLWLQGEGYEGPVGFDFVEYDDERSGERRFVLAEINARINGASYSTALFERLNAFQKDRGKPLAQAYFATKVETSADSFAALRAACAPLLFDEETGAGIVPYNIGRLNHHRCNVAVFGASAAHVAGQYREFLRRLPARPEAAS